MKRENNPDKPHNAKRQENTRLLGMLICFFIFMQLSANLINHLILVISSLQDFEQVIFAWGDWF
jgi:hypothetical protein